MALADPDQIDEIVISSSREIGLRSVVGATQKRIHKRIREAIRKAEEKATEEKVIQNSLRELSGLDEEI